MNGEIWTLKRIEKKNNITEKGKNLNKENGNEDG